MQYSKTIDTAHLRLIIIAMSNFDKEVRARYNLMVRLVKAGGKVALKGQQQELGVEEKTGPADIVTKWDRTVERLTIHGYLDAERTIRVRGVKGYLEVFPHDSIRSEEQGLDIAGTSGFIQVQDPIDGTLGFSLGNRRFGVSMSVHHANKAVAGVIGFPALNLTYSAIEGNGAFVNGKPVKPLSYKNLHEVGFYVNYTDINTKKAVEDSIGPFFRNMAGKSRYVYVPECCTLTMAELASGHGVGVYLNTNLTPYDLGADDLIIREAGGITTKIDWAKPRQAYLAAANSSLFDQAMEAIGQDFQQRWNLVGR